MKSTMNNTEQKTKNFKIPFLKFKDVTMKTSKYI